MKIKKQDIIVAILALVFVSVYTLYLAHTWTMEIRKNDEELLAINQRSLEVNLKLLNLLNDEQSKNIQFAKEIGMIASTVTVLDKLSKTDKELLQKYSRVYFLNEHYIPDSLSDIGDQFSYEEKRTYKIHSKVLSFLEQMINDAKTENVDIKVMSAYRSFGEQSTLKSAYKVTYGTGSNAFSADQGYSEHQLGTTLDFTTPATGGDFSKFESTTAYEWLVSNAHEYGFVLSYPKGNKYYVFEPWHWRFVGKNLANRLYEDKMYFYDLDQRTIDAYLISVFE